MANGVKSPTYGYGEENASLRHNRINICPFRPIGGNGGFAVQRRELQVRLYLSLHKGKGE